MSKVILFLSIFLLTSSLSWAYQSVDLSQHGTNLMNASFVIRYKFEQKMHKSWQTSTYKERKEFLSHWYAQQIVEEKKVRLQDKEDEKREREIQKAKKEERKRLALLAKADERVRIDEHKDKRNSKKKIDRAVKQMEKDIKALQNAKRQN